MSFTPTINRGVFLTKEQSEYGEHLVVGAAVRNPTDKDVHLRNMDSRLFNPTLKERTFTEKGTVRLWAPNTMSAQVVTDRTLKAGRTAVQTWRIPNAEEAYQDALETCEDLDLLDKTDVKNWMRDLSPVDPKRVGVVQVSVGFPAPNDYFDNLTRQFDLRHNAEQALDDVIPDGDEDAIETSGF